MIKIRRRNFANASHAVIFLFRLFNAPVWSCVRTGAPKPFLLSCSNMKMECRHKFSNYSRENVKHAMGYCLSRTLTQPYVRVRPYVQYTAQVHARTRVPNAFHMPTPCARTHTAFWRRLSFQGRRNIIWIHHTLTHTSCRPFIIIIIIITVQHIFSLKTL